MEKITLQNRKGQKLVGVLENPKGEIKGTAVLQHGWGGRKDKPTIQAIKRGFHRAGFQTFNFDTTNSFGESDGDFEKSTLGLHAEDLEDVVKWVQEQAWCKKPLALSGHSKGGYAVTKYAEDHVGEVDYLIPVAPVVSGKLSFEVHNARDPEELQKWKEEGVKVREWGDKEVNVHWFQMEERLQHDLLPNAGLVTIPTLIIVGSKDDSCTPDHMKLLVAAIGSDDKAIHVIEGAPHSYYEQSEQDDCEDAIAQWLSERA